MTTVKRDIVLDDYEVSNPFFRIRFGYYVTELPPHGYDVGLNAVEDRMFTDFPVTMLGDPNTIAWRSRAKLVRKMSNTSARYTLTWQHDRIGFRTGIRSEAGTETRSMFCPKWTLQQFGERTVYNFRESTLRRTYNVLPLQRPIGGVTLGTAYTRLSDAVGTMYYVANNNDVNHVHVLTGYRLRFDAQNQLLVGIELRRGERIKEDLDPNTEITYPELNPLQEYTYRQPNGETKPVVEATDECGRYRGGDGVIAGSWFGASDPRIYPVDCS